MVIFNASRSLDLIDIPAIISVVDDIGFDKDAIVKEGGFINRLVTLGYQVGGHSKLLRV